MKPRKPLGTTIVNAFAVIALCDNPLNANLMILNPNMDDITFEDDLGVLVMKYVWAYVKQLANS